MPVYRFVRCGALAALLLALAAPACFAQPKWVTVPLILEGNVPMVDIDFQRVDGSTCRGRFVVDTGGGGFLLTEKLAAQIGMKPSGPESTSEGSRFAPAPPPKARLGDMTLDLKDARVFILMGQTRLDERDSADGLLPGHILERYHIVLDYPVKSFTLALPGAVTPHGVQIVSPLRKQNGFPRIEATVGGETYGFLLDTGASYTMVSKTALEAWSAKPGWSKVEGAAGYANMTGDAMEVTALMTRIPELKIADLAVAGAGVVSRPEGVFERSMSNMMPGPIVGSIAGNILRQFRVEIDYANGVTYFEQGGSLPADDMDLVGLVLNIAPGGRITVLSVSAAAAPLVRSTVKPGDVLRSIDGAPAAGISLMQAVEKLRGKPGDIKVIEFERGGKTITLRAPVSHLL